MLRRSLGLALSLVLVTLAGCTDDSDPGPTGPTAAECEAQGLILGEKEVMSHDDGMDDGMEEGMEHMEHTMEPACVEPGPPAVVTIEGLPATISAYTSLAFNWRLETSANESHAMRTEVRYDTAPVADGDLKKPDDWGTQIAIKEHQNFVDGTTYDATFMPTEPGNYYLRAYALVSQKNVWSQEYVLNVTSVAATGNTTDIAVNGLGLPVIGGLSNATITIGLGDTVTWSSTEEDLGVPVGAYSISGSGPNGIKFTAETGGEAVLFTVPGTYSYTATGLLSEVGGTYSGTITVQSP